MHLGIDQDGRCHIMPCDQAYGPSSKVCLIAPVKPPWHIPSMPRTAAITESSLKSLGLKRLAALVREACDRDNVLENQVRMMLAAKDGGDALDAELAKRIKSLAGSRTFYDWRVAGDLVRTIDTIRSNIVDELGAKDPRAAVVRLWQLIDVSHKIMEIVDDSSGMTGGSLQGAVADLGQMLQQSGVGDAPALAERVHASFLDNGYCIKDGMVRAVSPALRVEGRAAIRRLFEEDLVALDAMPAPSGDRGGDYKQQSRRSAAAQGMMDLADAEGDVDAFLRAAERSPYVVAHVGEAAEQLLKAKRPAEALAWLDRVPADHGQWRDATGEGLVGSKLRALEALRRTDEAQALRWQMFERHLWTFYLREYVKRLPDFEDDAVIRKAIAHALAYSDVLVALMFLVNWPDLDAAAQLVTERAAKIDGRHYQALNHAVDRLEDKHPVATTILLRAKIDSVLARASSAQYVHAARDLARAAALAPKLNASSAIPTHAAYFADLKTTHARKTSFWPKVQEVGL
jgi:hypothetical protein